MLGLPDDIEALLFDMDGVLTQTATVHAKAWKQMFDEYLHEHGDQPPFDLHRDYDEYVDGKPREEGVRDFLASRDIHLSDDELARLGDRKNDLVQELIHRDGVKTYDGSIRYVKAARDRGLRTAVVSSSKNTQEVLQVSGIGDLFDDVVDGNSLAGRGLKGKPAPDMFLAAAHDLGIDPQRAAVFEDALAGVEAGHAGGFGRVVGVDRHGEPDALRRHGADVVVADLADLLDAQ